MNEGQAQFPWSVPIRVESVPESGRHVDLTADEPTRRAIAAMAGLRTLPRLVATFDITRRGRDGLHVTGEVSATVGQTCVVSLEPIDNEVVEAVDMVFLPPDRVPEALAHEVVVDPDAEEVEALVNGTVDLGAIATEFLMLGIDPHPRKPGIAFEAPANPGLGGGAFASLTAWKRRNGEN